MKTNHNISFTFPANLVLMLTLWQYLLFLVSHCLLSSCKHLLVKLWTSWWQRNHDFWLGHFLSEKFLVELGLTNSLVSQRFIPYSNRCSSLVKLKTNKLNLYLKRLQVNVFNSNIFITIKRSLMRALATKNIKRKVCGENVRKPKHL